MDLQDLEILQLIKNNDGDNKAVTILYKKYKVDFFQFIRKNYPGLKNEQIEDAYSECFHALYRNIKIGKLVTLTSSLKTYLFQIGVYKIIDEIKRTKRFQGQEIIDYMPPVEISSLDFFDDDEHIKRNLIINETVGKMTEPCKTILTLFWFDQKKYAEILGFTNFSSVESLKNKSSKCMSQLKVEVLSQFVLKNLITISEKTRLIGK